MFSFPSNLLRLLLKVTDVTTEHQKWPEISNNKKKHNNNKKGQSPPQELEESPCSGLYLPATKKMQC